MKTTLRKIGFYCPGEGVGGPWRYVHSLLRWIDLEEFDVTLFSHLPGEYPLRNGIRLVRLEDPAAASAVRPIASDVRRGGGGSAWSWRSGARRLARALPVGARLCAGFYRDATRVARQIRRQPVDLLHTQTTGCEESPLGAYRAGVPQVLGTFHVDSTVDVSGQRSGPAHRALEWMSNRCLNMAIAVSEATRRDWIERSRIPQHRVVTIHNGIDPQQYRRFQSKEAARAQLGLPTDAVILGCVGRLEPAKGFGDFIEAFARLRTDFPQALALIAGSGGLREQLEARAEAYGVSDRVVFLGFQSDVNLVLDALDIFVIPSLSETLGYALLEAMSHELPAVGTTVGGIPEVIVPGETGWLAPARNPAALAAAIGPLLASAELRRSFGHAGRMRVIKHFHESEMVRRTLDVYRRLLVQPGRV